MQEQDWKAFENALGLEIRDYLKGKEQQPVIQTETQHSDEEHEFEDCELRGEPLLELSPREAYPTLQRSYKDFPVSDSTLSKPAQVEVAVKQYPNMRVDLSGLPKAEDVLAQRVNPYLKDYSYLNRSDH